MLDPEEKARLDALSKRIAEVKGPAKTGPTLEDHHSQAQAGWRMVTELVTGLLLGFGIGYGLDRFFGTLPWLMILFTGLGFAAGIRVMMRTAAEIQAAQAAAHGQAATAAGQGTEDGDRGT
jgi:ATP synthase protein I